MTAPRTCSAVATLASLWLGLVAGSCAARSPEEVEQAPPVAEVSLEGWSSERIPLPPGFAPGLPSGDEVLLFAPGMFDAEAEDFWSYAFLMRLEETGLDAERLTDLFEQYYDGLLASVAQGRDVTLEDAAQVELFSVGADHYEAHVTLVDAFVTMEPVWLDARIRVRETGESSLVSVLISPQHEAHGIWEQLEAAVSSLEL